MNKKDLALLERAFAAEISAALEGSPRLMQTKATARADALVADGLLAKCVETWRGIRIKGYELTHLGRFTYCATCGEEAPKEPVVVSADADAYEMNKLHGESYGVDWVYPPSAQIDGQVEQKEPTE